MNALIRALIVGDEAVTLPTKKPASASPLVANETSADIRHAFAAPNPTHRDYSVSGNAGEGDQPSASENQHETVPAEPRFTYAEFMQRYQSELASARDEAVKEGFAQGNAEGLETGERAYAAQLQALAELIASLRNVMGQQIEGVTDVAVEIVYEAVVKIIGEQVMQRETVVAIVREIMRRAKDRSRLVARVAPRDLEMITAQGGKLTEGLNVGDIEIVGDDRVSLGGCLLETPAGNLDGRLEIQLQQLRDALLSAHAHQE